MSRKSRTSAPPTGRHLDPNWLMIAACALVLVLAPWQLGALEVLPNLIFHLVVVGLCLLEFVRWYHAQSIVEVPNWECRLVVTLALLYGITTISSVYHHAAFLEFLRVVDCILFANVVYRNCYRPEQMLTIAVAMTLGAAAIGRTAIIEQRLAADAAWRVFVSFANPNLLAGFLALGLSLWTGVAVATARAVRAADVRPATRVLPYGLILVAGVLLAGGLWSTGSRGGLVAGAAGTMTSMLFILLGTNNRAARRMGFLFMVVAFLGVGAVVLRISQRARLTATSEDHSVMFRKFTWKGTAAMIRARPLLGHGPGSYSVAYPRYAIVGFTRHPHNNYLLWIAEGGVITGLLALALLVTMALHLRTAIRGENAPLACGLAGVLVAFCVHGLIDTGWQATVFVLYFTVAWSLSAVLAGTPSDITAHRNRGLWFPAAGLLATAYLVAVRLLPGELHYREAGRYREAGAMDAALREARAAVRSSSGAAEYHLRLGHLLRDRSLFLSRGSNLDEALEAYETAATLMPTSPGPWLAKGQLLARMHRYDVAQRALEQALRREPGHSGARVKLGECLLAQTKREEARRMFQRVAELQEGPWGKYPALPELIDLNVARAYRHLAELSFEDGAVAAAREWHAKAEGWVKHGLEVDDVFWKKLRELGQGGLAPTREEWEQEQQPLDELKAKLKS